MTQAEKFLHFVKERSNQELQGHQLLFRIEGDELVVTRRWGARCRVPTSIAPAVKLPVASGASKRL